MALSFQEPTVPSAVLWDGGLMLIPLFAVTEIKVDAQYHLPAIGSAGMRAIAPVHDDTIMLRGLLVGASRYSLKWLLETQAEAAQRGSAAAAISNAIAAKVEASGGVGGLILVTAMTIRTDMQVKSTSFSVTAQRREVIDVTLTLEHVPRPSVVPKVLDLVSVAVGAIMDGAR